MMWIDCHVRSPPPVHDPNTVTYFTILTSHFTILDLCLCNASCVSFYRWKLTVFVMFIFPEQIYRGKPQIITPMDSINIKLNIMLVLCSNK